MEIDVIIQDYFFDQSSDQPISEETWISWFNTWLTHLQPDFSPTENYELSIRLTNDQDIKKLNHEFRHKNEPTDVLSFASLEINYPHIEDLEEPLYLGDIIISVETAHRQAQKQQHTLKTELVWLASHGLLHLLGWDHPDEDSLKLMLQKQMKLLEIISIDIKLEI